MTDRSIVVRLKADISDLRSKLASASAAIKSVATEAEQSSTRSGTSLTKIGVGLSKGLNSVDKHKQSIHTLGNGFTVLGVAAAAGVGVAVKSFADFDEAISHVAATGKDAQANIGLLRQAALQAGADTKFSATEAADGVESLLKAGVSTQDVLGGGLSGALNLAAAGNLDVADSAEAAASAMTQFGLQGKDVPHIADLLAAGAGKAQGEVSDMAAALNQSGLVASQFGLSIEETVGSLSAFAAAGLTGSDAGTSLKTMLQRLANPSDEAANEMKRLGLNVYDAQGQFVGMSAFAEQLKTRLSGLTDAQRNASLAIIGGADAVRPLSVLFKDGGDGISAWVSQVNDAGYAADTAGKRMDNLKGDFEQLTGSIQTGLIQGGSGANDFLRDLTQQATKAANAFGRLSPDTQKNALSFAAIAGGAALGAAGLVKLVTTAAAAKTALADLNLLSGRSGAALGKVGKAAAIAATAFVVAEAAGAGFDAVFRRGDASYADAGTALIKLGTSAGVAGDGMREFFKSTGYTNDLGPIVADIDGVGSALTRVLDPTRGQHFNDVISGWLPGKDQLEVLQQQFADLDGQIVQMASTGHLDQATAGFAQLTKAAADQGIPVDKLVSLFPRYKATLQESANALGVTTLSAQDYADWMGGKVPAAISAASKANPELAQQLGTTGAALEDTTVSAADAVQQLYTYADAMDAISASAGGAEEAIDAANASIKGGTHDQGTKQGRANQSALDNVGAKSRDSLSALALGGASQDAIDTAAKRYRKAYRQIAEDIGYSGKAARAFADDLIRTPKAVKVQVVTAGAKVSADEAAVLNHELQKIPEDKRARIVTIAETKGAKAAQNAIERIKDKRVIAKADGQPAGAKTVAAAMRALKDRLVLAKARGDKKGADDVRAAINRLKGKTVEAVAKARGLGEVRTLQGAVNRLTGKTINIRVVTTKSTRVADNDKADGGLIDFSVPRFANGSDGRITGSGGPREDNILGIDRNTGEQTAYVSVGEMVTNARSTANNFGALSTINANPDKRYGLVELADGGLPRWAKGSTDSDVANVIRLQRNVDEARNLAELAKALKAQEKATKSLTTAEQSAVDAIKELATSLKDPYRSKSTDIDDVLGQLQQGASDLNTFAAQMQQLKALGLSQGVIDQISAGGAVNGSELATQILAGGQSLVDSLNLANANLEAAAANVGTDANGIKPKKKAYGGPIWGGSGNREDDVPVLGSGGEFMVQEPIARSNMAFLQAFNAGRKVLPAYASANIQGRSSTHVDNSQHDDSTHFHGVIGDPDVWLRKANNQKCNRQAMSGFRVR